VYVDDVETVVEVLAERPGRDLLLEVLVGGRDDANVGLYRVLSADALETPILEHAKNLDLDVLVDLAYLVEEQGAFVSQLETALLARLRPRERTLLVPEQLALQERLGERRAVYLYERLVRPRRQVVYRVGDELLADARLPGDEHAGLRRRDAADEIEYAADGRRLPDDGRRAALRLDLFEQLLVAPRQLAPLEGALDEYGQVVEVDRLRYEVVRAVAHRVYRVLDGTVPGKYDDRNRRVPRRDVPQELAAGKSRHAKVRDDEVDVPAIRCLDSFLAVSGQLDVVTVQSQVLAEAFPYILLVVYDEYREFHRLSSPGPASSAAQSSPSGQAPVIMRRSFCGIGSVIVNVDPWPCFDLTEMSPPCSLMIL